MPPHIVQGGGKVRWVSDVFPLYGNLLRRGGAVQQGRGAVAARQFARPDFFVALFAHAASLFAERVLIDGDDLFVGQDGDRIRIHLAQVVAGDQGRQACTTCRSGRAPHPG